MATETTDKLARLRKALKAQHLDGAVFSTRANFAWLTSGGTNHVVAQCEGGVGALVVTAKTAWVVANRIEIERLQQEEPGLADFTAKTHPWTTPMAEVLHDLLPKGAWGSDDPTATGVKALPTSFVYDLRAALGEAEVRRYKALGRDCALVVETVARALRVGDSEHQAEADLAHHLLARGIQPHVLLVAFDQRLLKHRHPVPTAAHLRKMAMLVVCGQRHGLIANLTRLVHFGPLPSDLAARHEACCRVEAALWRATVPGAAFGKVLQAGLDQYKKEGVAKEWELHHQGGPTGYAGRDFLVVPGEKRLVLPNQAVAWNPSITGTKSEDTILIGADGARTVLTAGALDWPMVTVGDLKRPGIMVR